MSICNNCDNKKRGHLVNINVDKKLTVTILYNKLHLIVFSSFIINEFNYLQE